MISNAQKAVLHIAKQQLALSREDYEAILKAQAGVTTSNDLTNKGFDKVVRRFEELGFTNTGRKKRERRPQGSITPEQQALIAELYAQLGWTQLSRQSGFSKRQCGKAWPQTRAEAIKVIEGLKAMIAREEAGNAVHVSTD